MNRHFSTAALVLGNLLTSPQCFAENANSTQPEQPKNDTTTLDWTIDTQSPLGGLGVNFGPLATHKLSTTSTMSARASLGGSLTFEQGARATKATLAPTLNLDTTYNRNFLGDRLRTSVGLSASDVRVDENFYGTSHIKGFRIKAGAEFTLTRGIDIFAAVSEPLSGNLPRVINTGIAAQPFAGTDTPLKGLTLSAIHSAASNTKSATIFAGYQWKGDTGDSMLAGVACSHLTAQQHGTTIQGSACVPTFALQKKL